MFHRLYESAMLYIPCGLKYMLKRPKCCFYFEQLRPFYTEIQAFRKHLLVVFLNILKCLSFLF